MKIIIKEIFLWKNICKKYNKHSLLNQKCEDCNKSQKDVEGDFLYCTKCNKFICYKCLLKHPNNEKHNTINIKRYDSFCKIHCNSFCSYCKKCKKNICIFCNPQHESHDKEDLAKYNFTKETKNKFEGGFKNVEKKISNLNILKEEIIAEIDKIKKTSELEMKFYKILINAYKYEELQNNINYNIIQNLKKFTEKFGLNKTKLYERIYKKGIKYISYLKNIKQSIGQTNLLKHNLKTLNDHTGYITHISQLNDGRLISSSQDQTLKIYKKDTFEPQLSIKLNSTIHSFIQLDNGKIIACSKNGQMSVIKLTTENEYKIEQTLNGHNSKVRNVIEIRENVLISVSCDNTMKKWEIKNENKFENTKTEKFQNSSSNCCILKINENEFVTSSRDDKYLKFWDYNNF